MQSFFKRTLSTLGQSSQTLKPVPGTEFYSAPDEKSLFPVVDPAVDGEDCLKDCESCTVRYPAKFSVELSDKLYGHIKGWSTHLVVATGKTDWVRDVEDEHGSIMEAVGKAKSPSNGKMKLSASDMPVPDEYHEAPKGQQPTNVLLLPEFTIYEKIKPADVPQLIDSVVSHSLTTTTLIKSSSPTAPTTTETDANTTTQEPPSIPASIPFSSHPCPHNAVILLCSQKTRDARCGQSAPLLRKEFERHLRPLGLYRDLHDERPGGVGIYFISHVGGHKYSANVIIYRRGGDTWKKFADIKTDDKEAEPITPDNSAAQCIWLARVRPEDCEGIIKQTVFKGKVIKPSTQLRGGFDRENGLVSW